jgi:hypothetical protein
VSRCEPCATRIEAEASAERARSQRNNTRIYQLRFAGLGAVVLGIVFAVASVPALAVIGIVGGLILFGLTLLWGTSP